MSSRAKRGILCADPIAGSRYNDCTEDPSSLTLVGMTITLGTLRLELQRQLLPTTLHDLAAGKDVHEVRHDVVEQPLIVRDDDGRIVRATHRIHTFGDNS